MFVLKKTLRAVQESLREVRYDLHMTNATVARWKRQYKILLAAATASRARVLQLEAALAASQAALVRANVEQDSRVAAAQEVHKVDARKLSRMPYISDQAWAEAAEMYAKYRDEARVRAAQAALDVYNVRPAGWMAGAGSVRP